eukprot:SAG31_NODE_14109_length_827_cov_0.707418_1_plen_112_part_01
MVAARADACVKEACTPEELKIAQAMLWDHLEGNDCPGMRQMRPVGWKQVRLKHTHTQTHTHTVCSHFVLRARPAAAAAFVSPGPQPRNERRDLLNPHFAGRAGNLGARSRRR